MNAQSQRLGKSSVIVLAGRRIDAIGTENPRFPLKNVDRVAHRIHNLLDKLKPQVLICSGACGADLLALKTAYDLGLRRRIVLPFDGSRFRATSVVDRPGDWGTLFDTLFEDACNRNDLVIISSNSDDETAYAAVNERIITEAQTLATEYSTQDQAEISSDQIMAIIVWDGVPRGKDDLTAHFASQARKIGMSVLEIDTLH